MWWIREEYFHWWSWCQSFHNISMLTHGQSPPNFVYYKINIKTNQERKLFSGQTKSFVSTITVCSVFGKEKCEMRRKRTVWIAEETAYRLTNSSKTINLLVFDRYGLRRRQVILGYHTTSHSSCHHFSFSFSLSYDVVDEYTLIICVYIDMAIWTWSGHWYVWPNMCAWAMLEYVLKDLVIGWSLLSSVTSWWTIY